MILNYKKTCIIEINGVSLWRNMGRNTKKRLELRVTDVPRGIYDKVAKLAKLEKRTKGKQLLVLVEKALEQDGTSV